MQNIFNNSIKINSINLHFKETSNNEFYLIWCSGISFVAYENKERTMSAFKSSNFICDLDSEVIFTNNVFKKDENNEIKKCPNCNKICKVSKMLKIPISFIIKFDAYLRSQTINKQLRIENNDIRSYVTPILVLDHKEIDQDTPYKKKFAQLKIGVNK